MKFSGKSAKMSAANNITVNEDGKKLSRCNAQLFNQSVEEKTAKYCESCSVPMSPIVYSHGQNELIVFYAHNDRQKTLTSKHERLWMTIVQFD